MSDLIKRLRCVDSIQNEIDVSIICEQAADEIRQKDEQINELIIEKNRIKDEYQRVAIKANALSVSDRHEFKALRYQPEACMHCSCLPTHPIHTTADSGRADTRGQSDE